MTQECKFTSLLDLSSLQREDGRTKQRASDTYLLRKTGLTISVPSSLSPSLPPSPEWVRMWYIPLSICLCLSQSVCTPLLYIKDHYTPPSSQRAPPSQPDPLTAFRCVSGTVLQLQLRQAESAWPCDFWPRPVRLTSSSFSSTPTPGRVACGLLHSEASSHVFGCCDNKNRSNTLRSEDWTSVAITWTLDPQFVRDR